MKSQILLNLSWLVSHLMKIFQNGFQIMNIPFFVNTETGEIEQSFRQSWSPFPPRLVTLSGTVVH
jgi:hypothetical protein